MVKLLHFLLTISWPLELKLTITYHKGRTARIGNEGIATSFYNGKDEEIAPDLVKILMECEQPIPDFLQGFAPSDNVLVFDDDTDKEEEEANDADDGGPWRQYGEPEITTFELRNPQSGELEPGHEQAVSATEEDVHESVANPFNEQFADAAEEKPSHHEAGESQLAPTDELSW